MPSYEEELGADRVSSKRRSLIVVFATHTFAVLILDNHKPLPGESVVRGVCASGVRAVVVRTFCVRLGEQQ